MLAASPSGGELIAAGACEVGLFGSVARGESAEDSDIGLVNVCADLDCAWRWDRGQESARLGERAAGWPVDVVVTDSSRAGDALGAAGRLRALRARPGTGSAGLACLAD